MSKVGGAAIDRRVEVVSGLAEERSSTHRVSDLRPLPFVVLLGEPGIGKSTVLGSEASREQVPVLKVRALITGAPRVSGSTLFLDALDEYRIDGHPSDKAYNLARAIAAANAPRWRLSCRSEDWRKDADINAIQQTTNGLSIVVAQLLPLDREEAASVLEELGESDPSTFIAKAEAFGAGGFLESPLSLRLLHKAVANGGAWPGTRYGLFASAIERLAYERNEEHKWERRSSHEEIIGAAAKACLLLLASGARAIWQSSDEPPASAGDTRAFLAAHDLRLDRDLVKDTLDTALFRGEGEAFEPMHRTVAEYLAGQALAHAVVGLGGRAALPLSRAIALITGPDGSPPTELRGLYAWFAAHLAELGDHAGAMRMAEVDAVTVLAYGDAAVFDTPTRRAILANLDRDDPYFRASQIGITASGGLAGEDLSADFAAILTAPADDNHRVLTVLEVLASGPPVASIRPRLLHIACDPARPEWQRWRAADAWLNGAADVPQARRQLLDILKAEPVSVGREMLRAHLAAALPQGVLSTAEVKSIIADYERTPDDNVMMRLYSFTRRLEAKPQPCLFDEPASTWRSRDARSGRTIEVDSLLDHVLAATIRQTPGLSGARLQNWTANVRDSTLSNLGSETRMAISAWLEVEPSREIELFDAVLDAADTEYPSHVAGLMYVRTAGRYPSTNIIRHVLARSVAASTEAVTRRLLEVAVELARAPAAREDAYWETFGVVSRLSDFDDLLQRLAMTPIERWRQEDIAREIERSHRELQQRAESRRLLVPLLADLQVGRHPSNLARAARIYFHPPDKGQDQPVGLALVAASTDAEIAGAIAAGWEYLATVDLIGVDAAKLGAAEAENSQYHVEVAALAGLDRLHNDGRLPDLATMPVSVAIVVVKSAWVVEDGNRRKGILNWAVDRLNLDVEEGAAQLLTFWEAALKGGDIQLRSMWQLAEEEMRGGAIAEAVAALIGTHRAMAPEALRSAVRLAAVQLKPRRLLALANAALADPAVIGAQRTIWAFVAFALDPVRHGELFLENYLQTSGTGLAEDDLDDGLIELFRDVGEDARTYRNAMVVRVLGRTGDPADDGQDGWVTPSMRLNHAMRRNIGAIASDPSVEAGDLLASLIADPHLATWRPRLRHAQSEQTRLRRDHAFKHPEPAAIRDAVNGGAPANASDLRAVVMEELGRLRAELRTGGNTPWKRYWNVDATGSVTAPLIENQCRDHLLDRLHDRLTPYKIAAALPEARRAEETRSDMLIVSGAGRNLPIEAKRHFHPGIWTAASTQLQGYAAVKGADGFSIYLVFWFGNNTSPLPVRPDGSDRPTSAADLETMLLQDLSPALRAKTDVVVFDVSKPEVPPKTRARKGRPKAKMPPSPAP